MGGAKSLGWGLHDRTCRCVDESQILEWGMGRGPGWGGPCV